MSNFTITQGVDNTFVFTIKQNGSTLPMEISQNEVIRYTSITPSVTYVPYEPESKEADVVNGDGQDAIAAIPGLTENYQIYVDTLVDGTTYSLVVDGNEVSLAYSNSTYPEKYEYILALKTALTGNSAIGALIEASVDENKLVLVGKTVGTSYTVNGSSVFSIIETQTAQVEVEGVAYKPNTVTPGVITPAVPAHWLAVNGPESVDISGLVEGLSVTKIEIQPEISVDAVTVSGVDKTLTDGWYDIGTATSFTVTPTENLDKLYSELDDISIKVKVTLENSIDTFKVSLLELGGISSALSVSTNESTELGSTLAVKDALSGKIELKISAEDAALLSSDLGTKVDRYYPKPTYRMVIECNTLNNGEFLAKLPYVYVE